MRLSEFLRTHTERVLEEWEQFARSISPDSEMTSQQLRNNAKNMLEAIAEEMEATQSGHERHQKSQGDAASEAESDEVDHASEVHARERSGAGFDLVEVVSEYGALRASVTRLWSEHSPADSQLALDDIRRFHETIDQSMSIAVQRYTEIVDRSRKLFLAILGHDLRSPLAAIAMNARLLSESRSANTDLGEIAEIGEGMSSSAQAMDEIIQDLLVLAGAQLGASMPLHKDDVELGALVRDVARETRACCPTCTIRVEDPAGDLTGHWDRCRLRQMVSNLLGNAIQHGDGTVVIAAEAGDDDILLRVRNGGEPIPHEQLPFVFNPLMRAVQASERFSGSLGLGLYIVKLIVNAHDGVIRVRSTPGTGTVFTIRLPRRAESPAAIAGADPGP